MSVVVTDSWRRLAACHIEVAADILVGRFEPDVGVTTLSVILIVGRHMQ